MLEDRIRQSFDAALADLRARLEAELRDAVAEFQTVHDGALQAARADALAGADAERDRAVAEAEARVRATIDEVVAAAREEDRQRASSEIRAIVDAEAVQRLDEAMDQERHTRALALADAADRAEQSEKAAVASARVREREEALAGVSRLLDGVRRLDEARSLSDLLDALTDAAAAEAPRVAVLVLRGERVQGWKVRGFGARDEQPKTVDLALAEAGVVGHAVGAGRTTTTRDGASSAAGPGFAPLPADRMGLAVPMIVGGRVVAVVYADSVGPDGHETTVPNGWPELVEVLARHAARCLETLTVQRVVHTPAARVAVPAGARGDASAPAAPAPPAQAQQALVDDDEASARRYARLLLSEIKLYHEPVLDEARRERRLLTRLGPEIARARRLYEARIPAAVAARAALFEQELVHTLAGGDRSLLGQPA
ncbi:MAG: hypothetical protein Q8L86_12615 [Vicinamibacterales bacterium]|nr:hypothetical protein [Vicinamibacterales bacterium]